MVTHNVMVNSQLSFTISEEDKNIFLMHIYTLNVRMSRHSLQYFQYSVHSDEKFPQPWLLFALFC